MKPILKYLYLNSNNQGIKELIFKSFDNDPRIRVYIASNKSAPVFILEFLSKDKDANVRYWVAYNPRTPIHVLEKLSNDENDVIRIAIALNANTPIHVLEKLSNDIETRKYATNILTMKKKKVDQNENND